jgi:pyruvate/2-oxoglutarate dehydrogenase complex dihydrolipoamide dehydrogenase (E3) component
MTLFPKCFNFLGYTMEESHAGDIRYPGDRSGLAGAAIAGEQAGELIALLSLAMAAGFNGQQLEEWIIPHPTLSEVLGL